MPRRPAAFDGCVIAESLRDPTLINRLEVWRAWISPEEMLSDDQGTMSAVAHLLDRLRSGGRGPLASGAQTVALVRAFLARPLDDRDLSRCAIRRESNGSRHLGAGHRARQSQGDTGRATRLPDPPSRDLTRGFRRRNTELSKYR